jgi:anaerobic selenocysteine-containing dehydrogenase
MELMTFQADQTGEWSMWVEMNPRDAEALGLRNDEDVLVETSKGKTVCRLKLFAGVPPGTVSMPGGLGRESGGRYVEQIGTNPASLVAFEIDRLTGIPLWGRTPARVTRA